MNLLTRFGLARSRFTIAAMISLLVAGIALYPNFPKREDPVIVIRTAVVSALFPGMAPERMENLVAIPIERKIRELAEVKDIRTLVSEGSLTIYVDLKDEIGNVNATWQRLRDKMGDVKVELPDGVVGPFVNSDFGDVAIATIAVTGEGFSQREIKDVADDFRKQLYHLSGIAKVDLLGVQDERVWLELDTRKLAAVGVQVNTLIKDLQSQNVVLPSGNINADGTRLLAGNLRRFSERARDRDDADAGWNQRQSGAARRSRHGSPRLHLPQGQADLFQRTPRRRAQCHHAAGSGRHAARPKASRGGTRL